MKHYRSVYFVAWRLEFQEPLLLHERTLEGEAIIAVLENIREMCAVFCHFLGGGSPGLRFSPE